MFCPTFSSSVYSDAALPFREGVRGTDEPLHASRREKYWQLSQISHQEQLVSFANVPRISITVVDISWYSRREVYSSQELFKLSVKAVDTTDATLLQTYRPDSS